MPKDDRSNKSLSSLFWSHAGWTIRHDVPAPRIYARDLKRDKIVNTISRLYIPIFLSGIILPGTIGLIWFGDIWGFARGALWGGFARVFVGNNLIWSVNSICHKFGYRTFQTKDQSRNNVLISLFTFGEGFHNNHHAFPQSAQFGRTRWESILDSGYWVVRLLKKLGVAKNVRNLDEV